MTRSCPRVVAFGGGAGLAFLTGLAAYLRDGGHHHQHDLLTAIVPGAADMEDAESLLGPCACVLPATVDAGPVRRAYPETLRRIINADVIIAGPGELDRLVLPSLDVGGIAATLWAVNAVRILVAPARTDATSSDPSSSLEPDARHLGSLRMAALATRFDHVVADPRDPRALFLAVLRLARAGRPPLASPFAAADLSLPHAITIGPLVAAQLAPSRLHHD